MVRRLTAGGRRIRTIGPPPEVVVDPSGSYRIIGRMTDVFRGDRESSMSLPSREDSVPPPKVSVRRPGSDRWNLASTTFPDAGAMVRTRFPPAESLLRTDFRLPRP